MSPQLKGAGTLLLVAAVFALSAWFVLRTHVNAPLKKITDTQALKDQDVYWQGRIKAVGGDAAYKEFALAVDSDTVNERHTQAHVFGGALYKMLGEDALSVCDARFSYGCFHEFLGRAIQEYGLSEVNKLNEGCQHSLTTSPLSCQHGIGHGVLGYIGYTRADLDKALEVCKNLPFNDPIGGCFSGVFMEYNLRTMLGEQGGTREVVDNDIYAPCDSLPLVYQRACAFWQPQWWLQGLYKGEATKEVFSKVGAHCDAMESDPAIRRSCYEGLGTVTPIAVHYSSEQAAALCDAASASKLSRLYCRSYAANDITIEVNQSEGRKVCAGLTAAFATYCNAYAENRSNILRPQAPPDTP